MYENSSGNGGAENLTETAELSKVLVIVGDVQTSAGRNQWTLKNLCLDASTHQLAIKCVMCSFQISDVNLHCLAAAYGPGREEQCLQVNIHHSCWRKS